MIKWLVNFDCQIRITRSHWHYIRELSVSLQEEQISLAEREHVANSRSIMEMPLLRRTKSSRWVVKNVEQPISTGQSSRSRKIECVMKRKPGAQCFTGTLLNRIGNASFPTNSSRKYFHPTWKHVDSVASVSRRLIIFAAVSHVPFSIPFVPLSLDWTNMRKQNAKQKQEGWGEEKTKNGSKIHRAAMEDPVIRGRTRGKYRTREIWNSYFQRATVDPPL